MNRILVLLLVIFSVSLVSFGQKAGKSKIKSEEITELTSDLQKFVPAGYSLLGGAKGNLNLDKFPDAVLVLKKNNEEKTSDWAVNHPEKRPLLILLGQANGSFKLTARNDNTVYCVDCGGAMGDPFQGITITNGNFSVDHYAGSAWRWTRVVTYKYSPAAKTWYLFRDGSDSFHASEPDKVKTTVKTAKNFGKVAFEKFDIYKEEK